MKNYNLIKKIELNDKDNNEFYPKYDGVEPLDFYDIIVDINSIQGVTNGWEILMNERGKEMEKKIDKPNQGAIKIGVIGNGNKGKSFLLSKISDIDLPIGDSIKTKGLSIKFPVNEIYKNRNIILLDSAGQETPVLNSKNNKDISCLNQPNTYKSKEDYKKEILLKQEILTDKSRDKLLTEFFLQNYIVKYSDLLITVVGQLTFSEQKLINKIKKAFINFKKDGQLIVMHNLQSFVTKKQVENYIKETLKNSGTFDLEEQSIISKEEKDKIKWTYFYEPNEEPKTIHLIFARDKSEAGNFYNDRTIKHLYRLINGITKKEPLNLYENIKNLFFDLSNDILETPIDKNDIIQEQNRIKLAKKDIELKLKKCSIDELGINKFSSNGFEPKYCYYINKNALYLICEIPGDLIKGTFKCNASCNNGKCIITINGIKKDDLLEVTKNNTQKIENKSNREFGNFNLVIIIENVNIDVSKGAIQNKNNGLIEIKYDLKEESSELVL